MYDQVSNAAAQAAGYLAAYPEKTQPEQPLGESIGNIGNAATRLEMAQSQLEERLIGLRPTLASAAMGGLAPAPQRPLAMDARSAAERLHRVADLLEKLHQQL